jgi:hypothetical protein
MPGSKRRKAIAVLLFVQAALFGWGAVLTALFVITRTGDPSLASQLQLGIQQGAALVVTVVLAVFILRGSRPALYATAVVAALSALIDLGLAGIELFWVGPVAFLYLLFFPLPSVPLGVIAIPVLVLSMSVIRDKRVPAHNEPPPAPSEVFATWREPH